MANEVRIEARPWEPQDLIDDLQLMIDEEPDNYLNGNRTTLCMARDYLKKFFAEESLRPKGRWEKHWCDNSLIGHMYEVCPNCRSCEILDTDKFWDSNYCPNCGAKMMEG